MGTSHCLQKGITPCGCSMGPVLETILNMLRITEFGTGGLEERVEALAAGARMQAGGKAGMTSDLAGMQARLDPASLEQVPFATAFFQYQLLDTIEVSLSGCIFGADACADHMHVQTACLVCDLREEFVCRCLRC